MEKLSKLLNEYLESKEKDIKQFMNIAALMTQSDSKLYQTYIISKDFDFIKRLVENDKIDTDAYKTVYSGDLDKRKTLVESRDGEEIYKVTEHGVYESLLMLLSISDTPIEDLISYLK